MRAMKKQSRPTPLSFNNFMENIQGPHTCPNFMHSTSSPMSFTTNNFPFDLDTHKSAPNSPWLTAIPPSFTEVLQAIQTYNLLQQVQQNAANLSPLNITPPPSLTPAQNLIVHEVSRKVFVGGLPSEISVEDLRQIFSRFGEVEVDWPELKSGGHCNGYVFLIYRQMESVQNLLNHCLLKDDRFFYSLGFGKAQIRPWYLKDGMYTSDPDVDIDLRNAVFVGGVPRPATAEELHDLLSNFGKVVFASIDVDPEYHYPKGAGRVIFAEHKSFLKAINSRFATMDKQECHRKDIEIKPYVVQNQFCDQCIDEAADMFCSDISCVQYYCRSCFNTFHLEQNKLDHRIVIRDGERTKEIRSMQNLEHYMNNLDSFPF